MRKKPTPYRAHRTMHRKHKAASPETGALGKVLSWEPGASMPVKLARALCPRRDLLLRTQTDDDNVDGARYTKSLHQTPHGGRLHMENSSSSSSRGSAKRSRRRGVSQVPSPRLSKMVDSTHSALNHSVWRERDRKKERVRGAISCEPEYEVMRASAMSDLRTVFHKVYDTHAAGNSNHTGLFEKFHFTWLYLHGAELAAGERGAKAVGSVGRRERAVKKMEPPHVEDDDSSLRKQKRRRLKHKQRKNRKKKDDFHNAR